VNLGIFFGKCLISLEMRIFFKDLFFTGYSLFKFVFEGIFFLLGRLLIFF